MSCHGAAPGAVLVRADVEVLLVGNPNVGKSTLFNAMTGARQRVMNAPGTTVELARGTWSTAVGPVTVTDLPGTYSLVARSPDEQVVADALAGPGPVEHEEGCGCPDPALAVVLLDATAPARSLYLLAQTARSGRPVVVAMTMVDVAGEAAPDAGALAEVLGVPVVVTNPRAGTGLGALAEAVHAGGRRLTVTRPGTGATDEDTCCAGVEHAAATGTAGAETDRVGEAGQAEIPLSPDERAAWAEAEAHFAWVETVLERIGPAEAPRRTRSDRVDTVLLNPWVGLPVFGTVMWGLFQLGTSAAAPLMDAVDVGAGWVGDRVRELFAPVADTTVGPWVEGLLVDGILAGVGVVATFLPLMALMYAALALLEDSGYMARAALLADRLMRRIGLDGRAVLPLIVGFGCNLPALAATRTLPNARQRLLTGLVVPWTSCAARLTVYILLAGVFFPTHAGTVIFGMYVLSVVFVVGGAWLLRRTGFRDVTPEPLMLVLPAYQRPRLRAIGASVWSRVSAFATRAGKVIVVTLTVVWALMSVPATGGHAVGEVPVEDSLYGAAAHAMAPVFSPAGFGSWNSAAALVTGFVAKEVVVGAMAQTFAVEEPEDPAEAGTLGEAMRATFDESSGGHGSAAALAFMVFVLAYTPCLATVAEQWRMFGRRWALGATAAQLVIAWVAAVAVFQVGRLL